ncbi:hypothetical protein F4820DRAFT_460896 [Hypoxylon rubiginosum]|uniref:Uncharacterized protein n=1 Tax=Hypoxylon rubiginosum TaxID=110542 RepID=A0ACB9YQB1_9PEZI|nr:hypothetical protein F4820DRAFT_460896 [Hypoxylon rubiginosum]
MKPAGVLMVGSVPGASPQEVFTRLTTALPGRLEAVPDGETAWRNELGGTPLPEPGSGLLTFTLGDIELTAYDEIGLPSPYSVLTGHIKPELVNAIEPLYEQRFVETIDCWLIDTWHRPYFSSPRGVLQGLVDRVVRLCERIPEDVKLAFHLCYGDLRHKHFIEPQDTSLLVELANALLARETLGRRTESIHLPVPKERTDSDYLAPLAGLKLDNSSGSKPPYVYLGVVHANDEAGTKKRIETAQASVPFPFGVATECGLGRTPPEEIDSILRICKEATVERLKDNL